MSARLQLPETSLVEAHHLETVGLNQVQVWADTPERRRRWASAAATNVWQVTGTVTGATTPLDIPITANPTFTYAGQTFTFNSAIRVHRLGMRMSFTPDAEDFLPADTLVRMWPTSDPSDIQQVRFGDGAYTNHAHWDIIWSRNIHPIHITSGVEMAVQFLVPESAVPPLGLVAITLDDDEWRMWTGNQWALLQSPPPLENLINHAFVGVLPARHYDWEHKPLAINSDDYSRYRSAGRIPDQSDSPFEATNQIGDLLVGSDSHLVGIYGTGSIRVIADCRVQVLAVGPGGPGSRYERRPGDPGTPTYFGGRGGGGGEIVYDTWDLKAGDALGVSTVPGGLSDDTYLRLDHHSGGHILRSLRAHQGGTFWASRAGGSGVDRTTGTDPGNNASAPVVLADGAYGINRIVGRGNQGSGNTEGGQGGTGGITAGHNLTWIPGDYRIAKGGQGGSFSAAGAAGAGYGGGGGGGGLQPVGSVAPTCTVQATFDDERRQVTFTISSDRGTEFRYQYEEHAGDLPSSTRDWSVWQPWATTRSYTRRLARTTKWLAINAQARLGTATSAAVYYIENTEYGAEEDTPPTNLNVVFFLIRANRLRMTGSATGATQFAWQATIDGQTETRTAYTSSPTREIAVPSTAESISVRLYASNNNGEANSTFTWRRPTGPSLPAPGIPSVNSIYSPTANQVLTTWSATNGAEYRFRYTTNFRNGTSTRTTYSAWTTGQSSTLSVNPTNVSSIQYEVQARNVTGSAPASGQSTVAITSTGSGAILPPQNPIITINSFTNNVLSSTWVSSGATETRYRLTTTDDKGASTTTTYSNWGTTYAATYTVPTSVTSVTIEVQTANNSRQNIVSNTYTWRRTEGKPEAIRFNLSDVHFHSGGNIEMDVTLYSNGANRYRLRYKVLNAAGTVISTSSWLGWTSNPVFNDFQIIPAATGVAYLLEGEADNSEGTTTTTYRWNIYGGLDLPDIVFEVNEALKQMNIRWSSANATQYRYVIGTGSPGGQWTNTTNITLPLPDSLTEIVIQVEGRVSPAFLGQTSTGRWTRPTQIGTAPATPSVNLSVVSRNWTATWIADGAEEYQHQFSYQADGNTYTLPAPDYSTNTTASGAVPERATQISVQVTARNRYGTSEAIESRTIGPGVLPTIDQVTILSYGGLTNRSTNIRAETSDANQVRLRVTYQLSGYNTYTAGWSAWTSLVNGIADFPFTFFYVGVGTITVEAEARNLLGTVSHTQTVNVNYPPLRDTTDDDLTLPSLGFSYPGATTITYRLGGLDASGNVKAWSPDTTVTATQDGIEGKVVINPPQSATQAAWTSDRGYQVSLVANNSAGASPRYTSPNLMFATQPSGQTGPSGQAEPEPTPPPGPSGQGGAGGQSEGDAPAGPSGQQSTHHNGGTAQPGAVFIRFPIYGHEFVARTP